MITKPAHNVPVFRRLGLRLLLWILKDEKDSRTHEINKVLFERNQDGYVHSTFFHEQVSVGEHTYGVRRTSFYPYHPDDRVRIGKYCSIADGVKFVFGHHDTSRVSTYPFDSKILSGLPHQDALSKGDIEVGNDVWIGAEAIILSGVKIGDGAVVAAGGVVSRSVEPYAIVGGVPAKMLRFRLPESQISKLLQIQWWHWPLEKVQKNRDLFYGDVDAFIRQHGIPDEF